VPQAKEDKLAGIQFHLSDELYSDTIDDIEINFRAIDKRVLTLIGKLAMVDTPHYFKDEYEGIVHCESVMRAYIPPPSNSWKEMHSDHALSLLAFYGTPLQRVDSPRLSQLLAGFPFGANRFKTISQ